MSPRLRDLLVASSLVGLLLVGVVVPIWWFMVYAFSDEVTTTMHLAFLAGTVVLTALGAALVLVVGRRRVEPDERHAAAAAALAPTSVVVLGVLALGTVVSMLNEDQGSITADQPNAPFVGLVAACVVVATLLTLWAARRVRRR